MSDSETLQTADKKIKTLDEEIAAQQEKLRKLMEKKRETEKKTKEKNQKAVLDLIRTERLDAVPMERWQSCIEKIKILLLDQSGHVSASTVNEKTPEAD